MARQAKMGYVGYVRFVPSAGAPSGGIPASGIAVRVTSADIKLTQEISYPEVVDNKIDQTIYQLGPQQVGGNISFPLVHEGSGLPSAGAAGKSGSGCGFDLDSLVARLWTVAAQRDGKGRMLNVFDAQVRYADNLAYTYPGCLVNSLQFQVNQSEPVNITAEIIGGANVNGTPLANLRNAGVVGSESIAMLAPARIVTWNDVVVTVHDDTGNDLVLGEEIREFTGGINNQIERFYTLNGRLAPQDIAAKKRTVEGTLKVMGHSQVFSNWTADNETRFSSNCQIGFGYKLGQQAATFWATTMRGVVFEIEEVALSTGLFETSTKWRALGDCGFGYEAIDDGTGNPTAPNYPSFPSNGN